MAIQPDSAKLDHYLFFAHLYTLMGESRFVAVDVETANSNVASICQIGMAVFDQGAVVDTWSSLIDPGEPFDGYNSRIHGIDETAVVGAPTFAEAWPALEERLRSSVVVCHTPFDWTSITRAVEQAGRLPAECRWLDTARVVRRTWPQFARRGYGLGPVCKFLGIAFQHHDALEDARASGLILIRALEARSCDLSACLNLVGQTGTGSRDAPIGEDGNPDGPLAGEELVFTGTLGILRRVAAKLAAIAGCDVRDGVRASTTILVVGDQDDWRLAGFDRSAKHRKAEVLRSEGHTIRIIGETDFLRMLNLAGVSIEEAQ